MRLIVDGQPHEVEAPITVEALIARLGHAPSSVAVAVNEVFVPRGDRASHLLSSGDRVACFKPIVGG